MARLDVYPMPGRGGHGYVLDVQVNQLDHFQTRVVVPLMAKADAPPPIRELNPVFEINGAPHVMLTQAIGSIGVKELGSAVLSLNNRCDDVVRALDILLAGY